MKKLRFYTLLALLLMAGGVTMQAQNYDSIAHHNAGWYDLDLRNMMQLRDGNILANIQLFDIDEQGQYLGDYGNRLLKIAPSGAVLLDSVFVADDDLNYFLLERNPFDEDNIYAKVVRNLNEGRCDLRISFFDDDLNFYPEKEVWVPLSDTVFSSPGGEGRGEVDGVRRNPDSTLARITLARKNNYLTITFSKKILPSLSLILTK